jgi:hypothetical protein
VHINPLLILFLIPSTSIPLEGLVIMLSKDDRPIFDKFR